MAVIIYATCKLCRERRNLLHVIVFQSLSMNSLFDLNLIITIHHYLVLILYVTYFYYINVKWRYSKDLLWASNIGWWMNPIRFSLGYSTYRVQREWCRPPKWLYRYVPGKSTVPHPRLSSPACRSFDSRSRDTG